MPTRFASPPLYLDESQLVQEKLGDTEGFTVYLDSGAKFQDGFGGYMEIEFTPLVRCFWRVKGQAFWQYVNGSWSAPRTRLVLDPPDLSGDYLVGDLDTQLHSDEMDARGVVMAGCFALEAEETYNLSLRFINGGPAGESATYYVHPFHSYVRGYTFGHGAL